MNTTKLVVRVLAWAAIHSVPSFVILVGGVVHLRRRKSMGAFLAAVSAAAALVFLIARSVMSILIPLSTFSLQALGRWHYARGIVCLVIDVLFAIGFFLLATSASGTRRDG